MLRSRISTTLIILGIAILTSIVFFIYPLFNQIQKESQKLVFQKSRLAALKERPENLKKFQETYQAYQPALKAIDELFIDLEEPVNLIEFLEREAGSSGLSIKISPLLPEKAEEALWPSMNFRLALTGEAPGFLKFLARLESAPYLIKILNLNIASNPEDKIMITLLIKAYAEE